MGDSQWRDFYEHSADEGPVHSIDESVGLLGGEAAMWTERIDFTNMDCRLWPRAAAIAERLWSTMESGLIAPHTTSAATATRLMLHTHRLQRSLGVRIRPFRINFNESSPGSDYLLSL